MSRALSWAISKDILLNFRRGTGRVPGQEFRASF